MISTLEATIAQKCNKNVRRINTMNMFEMFTDEELNTYKFEEELNSKIQNITYTSDTVRASYIPRKDIIECGFWQDDVRVYLTFISADASDFSETFAKEALTAIAQSDADCVEKFKEIFKTIFGVKIDRAAIDVPSYGFSRGDTPRDELFVAFFVYYHNTQINIYLSTKEESKSLIENIKIKELANEFIDYNARLNSIRKMITN